MESKADASRIGFISAFRDTRMRGECISKAGSERLAKSKACGAVEPSYPPLAESKTRTRSRLRPTPWLAPRHKLWCFAMALIALSAICWLSGMRQGITALACQLTSRGFSSARNLSFNHAQLHMRTDVQEPGVDVMATGASSPG